MLLCQSKFGFKCSKRYQTMLSQDYLGLQVPVVWQDLFVFCCGFTTGSLVTECSLRDEHYWFGQGRSVSARSWG